MAEAANETALVVLHYVMEVALEELELEVGKVEATVVISCELIGDVQDNFIRVSSRHKIECHGASDPKHLLIRRDQLVKLQARM